jgi:shikimate kinase / 3-dehydroquinate synthase
VTASAGTGHPGPSIVPPFGSTDPEAAGPPAAPGTVAPPTIVLTGMMGTGKTTVGQLLAGHLGRPFLDLDDEIARAAGRSVAAVFAGEGEDGFRVRERAAVLALSPEGPPRVIATGGWTLADPASRTHIETLGTLVCLSAAPETIAARVALAPGDRPLLATADSAAAAALLARRRPVYDSVALQVDTTQRSAEGTAHAVRALVAALGGAPLTAIPVATPAGGYRVLVGTGLLAHAGALLAAQGVSGRVLVVTDRQVGPRYAPALVAGLAAAGLAPTRVEMGIGEAAKSLATARGLYDACITAGLDRADTVVALGGGVVSDTAGFVAATWLRGVRFVTVPTTLLAMVDAGLGGKTGVNVAAGKNLVGAFHHPGLVVADPTVLATLPPDVLRAGLAETVKHALIGDPELFAHLAARGAPVGNDATAWAGLVARSAGVKAAIVSADPGEVGRRAVLNLGHTFGHALEQASGYEFRHGDAVSVGLVAATQLAAELGCAPATLVDEVAAVLARLGLPTSYTDVAPESVLAAMAVDKKRRGDRLRFVLPFALGDVRVVADVPVPAVRAVLERLRA